MPTLSTDLNILHNDRVFIVGQTGSGKTVLARTILSQANRLIAIDAKGTFQVEDWQADLVELSQLRSATFGDQDFRLIVRPLFDEFALLGDMLVSLPDTIVYVDELYYIFPSGGMNKFIGRSWGAMWTRGRELGLGLWGGVQRPVNIPLIAMSEAQHYFCFYLALPDDKKRMAEIVGLPFYPALEGHEFVYACPARKVYRQYDRIVPENARKEVNKVAQSL